MDILGLLKHPLGCEVLFRKDKEKTAILKEDKEQFLVPDKKKKGYEHVLADAMADAEQLYWLRCNEQFCDI